MKLSHMKLRIIIYSLFLLLVISGIIIIAQKNNEGVTVLSPLFTLHCFGKSVGFECSSRYFELLTHAFGPKFALENLKQQYAKRADIVSSCHQLTHVIGNTAATLYKNDVAKAFISGDSFCWSGYYHGVVEHVVEHDSEEKFINKADTLCSLIPGKERYSFDYYNCVHGVGHGLMGLKENELFQALPLCDKLSGDWEKQSCYGGVFMENIMVDNRTHFAKYLKKDDLMYPCDTVDTKYKLQCYLMQTSYALTETNYDFKNAFHLCANVEEDFQDTCAQSIGRDASGNSVSNAQKTVEHCSLANNDRQERNCITGAVKDFISYFHGDTQAQALCNTFPKRFQEECNTTRISYLKTL